MENIKVNSVSEAWRTAERIFPTDYEKNEESSKRAGYPIYETTSTDERFSGFHISDLNTRLEVNMGAETVTIWIEEDAFEIIVKRPKHQHRAKASMKWQKRSSTENGEMVATERIASQQRDMMQRRFKMKSTES